jgi:hypothetical protein
MQMNMPEEFFILFITPAGVDKDNMTVCFHNQRPERKYQKVIFIGTVNPRP